MIFTVEDSMINVYYIVKLHPINNSMKPVYLKNIERSYTGTDLMHSITENLIEAINIHPEEFDIINSFLSDLYECKLERRVIINIEDNRNYTNIDENMKLSDRIDISAIKSEPKLIKSWDELSKVPNSHTHEIQVKNCSGNIQAINGKYTCRNIMGTHAFYGGNATMYDWSTQQLQRCGFNICLDNWDGDNVYTKPEDTEIELFNKRYYSLISLYVNEMKMHIAKIEEERNKQYSQMQYKPIDVQLEGRRAFEVFAKKRNRY